MSWNEFSSVVKSLNLPILTREDIATLHQLEKQWQHWQTLERRYKDAGIPADREAALAAFVENPNPANEQALLATANPQLVAAQYALLRRAYSDLRNKVSTKAGKLLRPVTDRIRAAVHAEYKRRFEKAEPVNHYKERNPVVIEVAKTGSFLGTIANYIQASSEGLDRDDSPLKLAAPLLHFSQPQKEAAGR